MLFPIFKAITYGLLSRIYLSKAFLCLEIEGPVPKIKTSLSLISFLGFHVPGKSLFRPTFSLSKLFENFLESCVDKNLIFEIISSGLYLSYSSKVCIKVG